jgi:hypothetical protein
MGRDYITPELTDPHFAPHGYPIRRPARDRKLSNTVDGADTFVGRTFD